MQQLPYVVITDSQLGEVYDLYYHAFDTFRKVREIKTLEDNDRFCETIGSMLQLHLPVIPKLAMGVLESSELMDAADLDKFTNTILRSVSEQSASSHLPSRVLAFSRTRPLSNSLPLPRI